MFKDYYKILGISRQASAQEIKSAYRTMSKKWHPDINPGMDVTSIMQDINEAYAILKDENKKKRYDNEYDKFFEKESTNSFEQSVNATSKEYEYDYEVQDEILNADIINARQYAKDLVDEFLKSFKQASQDAVKGAWSGAKGYIYIGICFVIFSSIIGTCVRNTYRNGDVTGVNLISTTEEAMSAVDTLPQVDDLSAFHVPQSWTRYYINKSFSISVPNSVELRNEYDVYTRSLEELGYSYDYDVMVFQQKGLSSKSSQAMQHYCRIMILHGVGNADDFLRSNQIEAIDDETKSVLRDLVVTELAGFDLLGEPSYQWIDINGIKAMEIKYRRSGTNDNTTHCSMYLLFNYDEMVKMVVSYREQEKKLWVPDLDNVIKTFKWE